MLGGALSAMRPHDHKPAGWADQLKVLESKAAGLERELRMVGWGIPIAFALLALWMWLRGVGLADFKRLNWIVVTHEEPFRHGRPPVDDR